MSPVLKTRTNTAFILQALPWQAPEEPYIEHILHFLVYFKNLTISEHISASPHDQQNDT